jgi:ABC-2 type transport system ATP-binding protein
MTLLGHNGAGKSTLISYLLGFYTHSRQHPFLPHFAGHVQPLDRAQVGYAPEAPYLDESASALDYLRLMAPLKGVDHFDIEPLFARVGLVADPKKPIAHYSKGMKQRLLIALALLGNPRTLVLDEPTGGLDLFGHRQIGDLLLALKASHHLIVSTHSLDLAWALGNPVWILKEGRIIYQETPQNREALEAVFLAHRPARID